MHLAQTTLKLIYLHFGPCQVKVWYTNQYSNRTAIGQANQQQSYQYSRRSHKQATNIPEQPQTHQNSHRSSEQATQQNRTDQQDRTAQQNRNEATGQRARQHGQCIGLPGKSTTRASRKNSISQSTITENRQGAKLTRREQAQQGGNCQSGCQEIRTPEQHKASTRKAKASIKDHNRKFYGFDLSLSINGEIRK